MKFKSNFRLLCFPSDEFMLDLKTSNQRNYYSFQLFRITYSAKLKCNCLVNGPWFWWFYLMCIISSAQFSTRTLTSDSETDVLYSFNSSSDSNNDFVCNSDLQRVRNFSEKSIRKRSVMWWHIPETEFLVHFQSIQTALKFQSLS